MAAVGFFVAAPQILQGTQGLMTPEQNAAMLPYVSEFTPAASLADWITFLSGAIFAFSALLAWAWKMRRTQTGKLLAYTAACILASVALAAHNLRFAGYPEVASAILLPVLLSSISAASLAASAQSAARLVTILAIVGLPAAYNLLAEPTHMARHIVAHCVRNCRRRRAPHPLPRPDCLGRRQRHARPALSHPKSDRRLAVSSQPR